MAEALKWIYNRRHPERTDYYRIIEDSFDEFERGYPEQFEEQYGYLRTEVMKAIYSFSSTSSLQVWSAVSLRTVWQGYGVMNAVMTSS